MPAELSLVVFGDFAFEFVVEPFWSVVDQPAAEMGGCAAGLLLARVKADPPPAYEEIVLSASLVVRSSAAPPPDR